MPIKRFRDWINEPIFPPPIVEVSPMPSPDIRPSVEPLRFRVFANSDEFVAWQDMGETNGTGYEIVGWKPVAGNFARGAEDDRLAFGIFVLYRERANAL